MFENLTENLQLLISTNYAYAQIVSMEAKAVSYTPSFTCLMIQNLLNWLIMSITYKPKKRKRKKTHGFLKRNKTKAGKRVIQRRRRKKRTKLTV